MHVGIITHQTGHLKTWQMLLKLMTKPIDVSLYAFPFALRPQKSRAFQDRPFQLIDIDIKGYCLKKGLRYVEVPGWNDADAVHLGNPDAPGAPDVFLTVIAKIIPRPFIENRVIINAHPGMLPYNRGVDAFKWSIVNCWPVGVSLHVIDEAIDRGIVLKTLRVPVLPTDRLRDVADRAYEVECDLQANFDYYLPNLAKKNYVSDEYPLSKKSIPGEMDTSLEEIFLQNRPALVEVSLQGRPGIGPGSLD